MKQLLELPEWITKYNTPEQLQKWMNAGNLPSVEIEDEDDQVGDYGVIEYINDHPQIIAMDMSKDFAIFWMIQETMQRPGCELELFKCVLLDDED